MAPRPPKFKYISYHAVSKTWVVQRRGYTMESSTCLETAVAIAMRKFKLRRAELLKQESKAPSNSLAFRPKRKYRFITWNINSQWWQIQRKGSDARNGHKDQDKAAAIAAKAFGLTLKQLQLPKAQTLTVESVKARQQRFSGLMRIYAGTSDDSPHVPGDLADLEARAKQKGLHVLNPGRELGCLMFLFLAAKYKDHRDMLEQEFLHASKKPKCVIQHAYHILKQTMSRMDKSDLAGAWTRNVGRKNSHHRGLIPLLQTGFKLLRKVKRRSTTKPNTVTLGKGKGRYAWQPLTPIIRQRLQGHHQFGQAMLDSTTPKTWQNWKDEFKLLAQAAQGPPRICGSAGSYRGPWIIRCWLIFRMRRDKIKRLSIDGAKVSDFQSLFPDQKKQLARLSGKAGGSMLVTDLFKQLKYPVPKHVYIYIDIYI